MRLLEIGCGRSPLLWSPGLRIKEDAGEIEYNGIDVREEMIALHKNDSQRFREAGFKLAQFAVEDMVDLPFENGEVDLVWMKDVPAEHSMPFERTGSSRENIAWGFLEVFRVLRPDGRLVMFEQNTPTNPLSLAKWLCQSGFFDIRFYMNNTPAQHLLLRSQVLQYYDDRGRDKEWKPSRDWIYLLEAKRPEAELIPCDGGEYEFLESVRSLREKVPTGKQQKMPGSLGLVKPVTRNVQLYESGFVRKKTSWSDKDWRNFARETAQVVLPDDHTEKIGDHMDKYPHGGHKL